MGVVDVCRRPAVVAAAFVLALAALVAAGCGDRTPPPPVGAHAASPSRPVESRPARPRIVALGDSLTAGYGLMADEAYPAILQKKIDEAGYRFEVVNAGVSGDTSAGGLRRLDWALDGDVRILILELGANDGLRGLPVEELKQNLAGIIERARARHVAVLLVGMEVPRNAGPAYTRAFHDVFPALAREYRLPFVPFLLEQVAGRPDLNQADGVHPNRAGARLVADTVWPALEPLLKKAADAHD